MFFKKDKKKSLMPIITIILLIVVSIIIFVFVKYIIKVDSFAILKSVNAQGVLSTEGTLDISNTKDTPTVIQSNGISYTIGNVSNLKRTYSTYFGPLNDTTFQQSRLDSKTCWLAKEPTQFEYMTMELSDSTPVYGIVVSGRQDQQQYVKTFYLKYIDDNGVEQNVDNGILFNSNIDTNSRDGTDGTGLDTNYFKFIYFNTPVNMKKIKILPVNYYSWIAMRCDLILSPDTSPRTTMMPTLPITTMMPTLPITTMMPTSPSTTMMESGPSTTMMDSGPSTTMMGSGTISDPSTTMMGSGPSTTMMGTSTSTTMMGSGPSTTMMGSGPSTTMMASGTSTTMMGSGPSTTMMGSGPSTTMMASGPSTTMNNIPITTYGYKINPSNVVDNNPQTNLYQQNFDGTSNVYAPYIYHNMETFSPLNLYEDKLSPY